MTSKKITKQPPPPQPKLKQQEKFHQSDQSRHVYRIGWLPPWVYLIFGRGDQSESRFGGRG